MTKPKNVTPPEELALIVPAEPSSRLDTIQQDIMSSWSRGIEEEFAIGHLLVEAATILDPSARKKGADGKVAGSEFSDWFNAQGFPFSMKTAYRLRTAAEREPEVRALIEEKTGRDMGVNTAVAQLLAGPKAPVVNTIPADETTQAHPLYAALRAAHRTAFVGRDKHGEEVAINGFQSMHTDDMVTTAGWLKELVEAYQYAKKYRALTQAERTEVDRGERVL